jgi:predicted phage terminase large subunit-like protein
VNVPAPREKLERFGLLLAEYKRREAKKQQSQRGWYDDDGVRQGGLMAFIRYYWRVLEPETELVEGWALYAICEHLEAVAFGDIKRLLITVPPGFMKSLCTDVFFPAWMWGPLNRASHRFVAFSYSASLTERDNERFRDLIIHPSYQALWRDRVTAVKIGATKVSNTRKGWKLASSVGGVGTGERADTCVLDDAHNIKEAESEIVRQETVRWFRESMSDRLNSMQTGAIIVIMQRAHEDDVAGAILSLELPYCHLMIPMEYEWERQVDENGEPYETDIGWIDPRYVPNQPEECDGALAWPERFPPEEVAGLKAVKGPYAYAGQYQQAPAPRGGGIFKREWWQLWEAPNGMFPVFEYLLASLDSAFTEKEHNDPSALTVWGVFRDAQGQRRIMLVHAWRKHLQFSGPLVEREPNETTEAYRRRSMPSWGLVEWVADTCRRFKVDKLLIEAKASGISAGQELQKRHGREGWAIQLCPVSGDKVARALAVQSTFSQMMIYAPARDWADMVIDETAVFPKGKYKDLTDSTTQAIKHLRDVGLAQLDDEMRAEEAERVTHRPRPKALYPC